MFTTLFSISVYPTVHITPNLVSIHYHTSFPESSVVKNLPAINELQEMQVQSLGQEGPLEKEMLTHSSILAWEISWAEEPGGLQSMGSQGVRHD